MKQSRNLPAARLFVVGIASAAVVCGQGLSAAQFFVGGRIMRDSAGAILGASTTTNSAFPVTPGAYQTAFASALLCSGPGYVPARCPHGIVAKYSPDGHSIVWATFLGGTTGEELLSYATLDPQNNVWVAGYTTSTDFPITGDAVQKTPSNYFLAEVSADGRQLLYSSFVSLPVSVLAAPSGSLYVAGVTGGQPFSVTPGAYRTTPDPGVSEVYVIKFDPTAKQVLWATLVGPAGMVAKIVPGADGTLYVGGTAFEPGFPVTQGVYSHASPLQSLFVTAVKPDGSDLAFSTVIGGSGGPVMQDMVTDAAGNIYVAASAGNLVGAGNPISPDLPTTSDAAQPFWGGAYLMKLSPDASRLMYASYMGRDSLTNRLLPPGYATQIQLSPDGKLHIMWSSYEADITLSPASYSPCFPDLDGGYQQSYSAYVRLTSDLKTVDYATVGPGTGGLPYYFDTSGNLYLPGNATDYFTILNVSQAPHPGPVCVGEYITKRQSAMAPGLLVSIYGSGIGPSWPTGAALDGSGKVTNQLAGAQVLFDGMPAPILYAGPSHIDAVVPFGVATSGDTTISVLQAGNLLGTLTAPLQPQLMRAFTTDGTGYGAMFWNQDGTPNSPANPANGGDFLTLYMTGAGQMSPQPPDGAIPAAPASVPQITLSIGGTNCPVTYAGDAPGQVEGVVQINCQLEKSIISGVQTVWVQSAHDSAPGNWYAVFSK